MNERLHGAAIIITLLAPVGVGVLGILVFTLHRPAGLGAGLYYSLVALPVGVLAIYKARTGGGATLILGAALLFAVLVTDHYPQYYVPISGFSIVGGSLHMLRRR